MKQSSHYCFTNAFYPGPQNSRFSFHLLGLPFYKMQGIIFENYQLQENSFYIMSVLRITILMYNSNFSLECKSAIECYTHNSWLPTKALIPQSSTGLYQQRKEDILTLPPHITVTQRGPLSQTKGFKLVIPSY